MALAKIWKQKFDNRFIPISAPTVHIEIVYDTLQNPAYPMPIERDIKRLCSFVKTEEFGLSKEEDFSRNFVLHLPSSRTCPICALARLQLDRNNVPYVTKDRFVVPPPNIKRLTK